MKKIYSFFILTIPFITETKSQNVGIGTATPQQKLEVAGWIELGSESEGTTGTTGTIRYNSLGKIQFHNGTAWVDILSTNNNGDFIQNLAVNNNFGTGQSASADITGNAEVGGTLEVSGNVGIGTASPGYKLDVSGNIRATTTIEANANGTWYLRGGDDHELRDINQSNFMGVWGIQNADRAGIQLGSGGSYIFGLSGNIGIGTISPNQKLEVAGNARITSLAGTGTRMVTTNANGDLSTNTVDIKSLLKNPVTGGGTISWDGTTFSWTSRIIVIPVGDAGAEHLNTAPWSTYTTPTSIAIGSWNIAYMRPIVSDLTGDAGTYNALQTASYTAYSPDEKDIVIAVHNGDDGLLYTAWGVVLKTGESYSNTSINYNRDIRLGTTYGSLHYGTSGNLGSATSFTPDGANPGLWVEGNNNGSEGGGIFMNGNTMCLWSPGDNDMFRFYDEDDFTTAKMVINSSGNVGIGATAPAVKLAVGGNGSNVYNTSAWIENNLHVQGNETLTQGGRGKMRVGTAWNYIGLYAEGSSTGANNDLVLGASSGIVRVGPYAGAGQSLRWANSLLTDDQGGSIELGGTNSIYTGATPYIDFHCNSGYTRDYDTRLIASVDAYGPILTMYSYRGTTNYRYMDLDWIGAYDNWADVSAWRYWANDWDYLYDDVHNDLDLIDNIRPQRRVDPKSGKEVITNDPTTVPSFLTTKAIDNPNSYKYDINRVSWFSIGAIRQLRKETKTRDEDLESRVERLESLLADLTGKKLDKIPFVGKENIHKDLSSYVVIDPRITANDNIVVSFENSFAPGYKINDIRDGSFEIVFESPLEESVKISYTVQ